MAKNTTSTDQKKEEKLQDEKYIHASLKTFAESTATYNIHKYSPLADDAAGFAIIKIIQQGISFKEFNKLFKDFEFSDLAWSKILGISPKTFDRYRKDNTSFDTLQSDFILQVLRIFNYGTEVFGSTEKFTRWLNNPNTALNKAKPIEIIDSSLGINMVYSLIGRIDYGVYS